MGANKNEIENGLKFTFRNVQEQLFGFFITHTNFIAFEFSLMFPDFHELSVANASKLRLHILMDTKKEFRAVKISQNIKVSEDVKPFLILSRMIVHVIAKEVTNHDSFVTSFSRIIEYFPHNTPTDTILLNTTNRLFRKNIQRIIHQ